jgi:hypothetical protein
MIQSGLFSHHTPATIAPTGTTFTVDWEDGNVQLLDTSSASGDLTATLSNPAIGAHTFLIVTTGGTARQITWPASVIWPVGASAPVFSTSSVVRLGFLYDGTNYRAFTYAAGVVIPVSSPGSGAGTEAFGASALDGGGLNNTTLGDSAGVSNATSDNSVVIGQGSEIQSGAGDDLIVIGQGVTVSAGFRSIVIGQAATNGRSNNVIIGEGSTGGSATSDANVVVGQAGTIAAGSSCVAIGQSANTRNSGVAVGASSITQDGGVAVGQNSSAGSGVAAGQNSDTSSGVAIGNGADSSGDGSIAIGNGATALGTGGVHADVAIGDSADAHIRSVAVGHQSGLTTGLTTLTLSDVVSVGYRSGHATGADGATAVGASSHADHSESIALGFSAVSTAANRCTIGTIGGVADVELQVGLGLAVWGSTPPAVQPTITGSRAGNAALASLLTALAATGLIVDGTTA